jgi:antibiotic biosynthesis monooxygenase (ABM) superfamily enzyme
VIVYEVNLRVQRRIEAEYRAWLDEHVRSILALPGFVGASVFERLEPPSSDGEFDLCVHYRLVDESALATYLREHAPRLRAEGLARFGNMFHADRRVLRPQDFSLFPGSEATP